MRHKNDDIVDDLIAIFARVPTFVPFVVAALVWVVCAVTLRSIPALGPILALLILVTALRGWVERRRRRGIVGRARTMAGMQRLTWGEFEDLLEELFHHEGYRVEKTASGADGGVDHILQRDGSTMYVQAKHWKAQQVPLAVVQRTYGVAKAARVTGAMVVTSGSFSPPALAFARDVSPEVELVDGAALFDRLGRFGLTEKVTTERQVAPSPLPSAPSQPCPRCSAEMRMRHGAHGTFLGCSRFPSCRGTRQLTD